MQIILMMSKEHVRLAIPKGSSLPGPSWPGVDSFISLIQASRPMLEVLLAKAYAALPPCMRTNCCTALHCKQCAAVPCKFAQPCHRSPASAVLGVGALHSGSVVVLCVHALLHSLLCCSVLMVSLDALVLMLCPDALT